MKINWLKLTVPALMLTGALAHAGFKSTNAVVINSTSRYAYGSLGSARNSADGYSQLGCTINSNGAVSCLAEDANANQGVCYNSSPSAAMVQTVAALHGDSYVYFTWDASNTCTYILVQNGSAFAPKAP